MQEMRIFENAEFGRVRTAEINGEPYFVGKDVADILGYTNPRKAIIDHVDDEDKGVTKCDTLGGIQEVTVINESGVYSLIFSSKLPGAKRFKRWVTSEVLPSIRKTGGYDTKQSEINKTIFEMLGQLTETVKELAIHSDRTSSIIESTERATLMTMNRRRKTKTKLDELPDRVYAETLIDIMFSNMSYKAMAEKLTGLGYGISYGAIFRFKERITCAKKTADGYEFVVDGYKVIRVCDGEIIRFIR